jgi:hypothetical protein
MPGAMPTGIAPGSAPLDGPEARTTRGLNRLSVEESLVEEQGRFFYSLSRESLDVPPAAGT